MTRQPEDILTFWFEGDPSIRRKKWFEKDPAFDAACAAFAPDIRAARDGAYAAWTATPRGALALIVLLDQLSRNVFRNTPEAFAADPMALGIARAMVKNGVDTGLTSFERMFVYLPFEHAEAMEEQNESVRLFSGSIDIFGADTVDYALRHRAVIQSYGRFPHRNAILGRSDTAAEKEYLSRPGAGF